MRVSRSLGILTATGLAVTIGLKVVFQGDINLPTRAEQLNSLANRLAEMGFETAPLVDIGPAPTLMVKKADCLYSIATVQADGASEQYYVNATSPGFKTVFMFDGKIYEGRHPRVGPFFMQQLYKLSRAMRLSIPFLPLFTATYEEHCLPDRDFSTATKLL